MFTFQQVELILEYLEKISGYAPLVAGCLLCITFGIGLLCAMHIFDVRE